MTLWLLLAVLGTGQACEEAQALGRRAYEERNYSEATVQFTRAVDACGATTPLLLALAQAQLFAQRPADALTSLGRIAADDPEYVHSLKVKAKALYLLGRGRDAEAALKTAATLAPADADIPYDLGRIYYQRGRHTQAAESLRRAVALDPQAYKAWDALGLAYEALGDDAEAQRHYVKAIALVHKDHPRYDVVYANFAELLIRLGNFRRAFDLAVEAAERNPDEPRNFFLGGKALVQLGRDDISVRWFEQAVKLDPDYPEPYYLLAQAYRRLGRTEDAERALKSFESASARAPKVRR